MYDAFAKNERIILLVFLVEHLGFVEGFRVENSKYMEGVIPCLF